MMEITGDKIKKECKDVDDIWMNIIKIYTLLNNIQLPISEEKILSYFCQYGINKECEKLIIKDRVVSKKQILSNLKTSLLKKNLIIKIASKDYDVIPELRFTILNNSYFLILKLFTNVSN